MANNSNNSSKSAGIGFLGLLTICFIVLKLCKVIDWSWWYVLAPLWAPIVLMLALVIIVAFFRALFGKNKDI